MNPMQALNADELDELDAFLISDDTPENGMDISALDGFFAALVLNPMHILPSEYLPWIWDMEEGEESPSFASMEQANHTVGLLMRYYNSVLDAIGRDDFDPLFYILVQADGSEFFDAESWCVGFMRGVFLFSDAWADVFERHPEFLASIALLGTEHGWEMLDKCEDVKLATQEAYESISAAVALLYTHFSEQREAEVQKRRVSSHAVGMEFDRGTSFEKGGDEVCPCGSGLKFKNCCGASPTLH